MKSQIKFPVYLLISLTLIFSACSSNKVNPSDIQEIKTIVQNKDFIITSDVAFPRATYAMTQIRDAGLLINGDTSNRISLIGNPNFLKIEGDSVTSQLPYFGERQVSTPYNSRDMGISLKGRMEDYKEVWNEEKNRYEITFKARDNTEGFNVTIYLFPKKTANMILMGTKR
ncbi:MAG: DUF4251 domain-containing protein, partial [Flavobacteriaceae bacterium]|nr:DUF4251 domain-containing protein [Flavobacteriaceae bacterium]